MPGRMTERADCERSCPASDREGPHFVKMQSGEYFSIQPTWVLYPHDSVFHFTDSVGEGQRGVSQAPWRFTDRRSADMATPGSGAAASDAADSPVKVFARFRPLNSAERERGDDPCVTYDGNGKSVRVRARGKPG